ncbi:MAG: hypothetical protein AB7I42_25825 [Bradyrhizobium sp.]|uniref:hypothetical protein n=1 Tax=Bradyrhizobium sp. TaxID=376 RepID=UPI003D0C7D7D
MTAERKSPGLSGLFEMIVNEAATRAHAALLQSKASEAGQTCGRSSGRSWPDSRDRHGCCPPVNTNELRLPTLNSGEMYAGIVCEAGRPSHHLILLPGEREDIGWNDAMEWADQSGGELPTRSEQALLFANLKDQFKEAWYWSGAQHVSRSDYAWAQGFYGGFQYYYRKHGKLRARAVRRSVIQSFIHS